MKWLRRSIWVILPLLAGGGAYCWSTGGVQRLWAAWTGANPIYHGPESIDLGTVEEGQRTHSSIRISNRGGKTLVISDVSSSCTCAGLERKIDGEFKRVGELSLGEGEETELFIRLTALGPVGRPSRQVITFRTSDPTRPEAAIELVVSEVTGGISADPSRVVFGRVLQGERVRQIVEIVDQSDSPRSVDKVTCSNEDVSVRLLDPVVVTEIPEGQGALIGRLEVSLRGERVGPVTGRIDIELSHNQERSIDISGSVYAPVELHPPSLSLPLRSRGALIYQTECLCRSTTGVPLRLEVKEIPAGLRVQFEEREMATEEQRFTLTWDPSEDPSNTTYPRHLRFLARLGEKAVELDILVDCLRHGEPR